MPRRLDKLNQFILARNADGVIISKPENIRYFSGFTGSNGMLIISDGQNKLLTDFRYLEQASLQAPAFEIVPLGSHPFETLGKAFLDMGCKKAGFESDFVTWDVYGKLADVLPQNSLIPCKLDGLRMIKGKHELALIKKAVEIADNAFTHVLSFLKPGISEQDVAVELSYQMRKMGSEKEAFDTIVASGIRGALPHGQASSKVIEVGDMITMDFGAVYQGYHSDMTRTVVLGKANLKQQEVYSTVLTAQLVGIEAVKVGHIGRDVDALARKVIVDAGFGDYFGHGLGHGVGLFIHEEPRLSPGNTSIALEENMVVTVEPGIYLPAGAGYEIEDMVIVSAAGAQVLTASNKRIIEIDL